MRVSPLSFPQVDWKTFTNFTKEVLGYSPTRGLDSANISLEKPSSFLASLDFSNDPVNNLRKGRWQNTTFEHLNVSFIGDLDDEIILEIINNTMIKLFSKKGRKVFLCILTASMTVWHDAVVYGCSEHATQEFRIIFNQILNYFERAGFDEVWSKYNSRKYTDGTTVLS